MKKTATLVIGFLLSNFFSITPLEAYVEAYYDCSKRYDPNWAIGLQALCWQPYSTGVCSLYEIPEPVAGTTGVPLKNTYNYGVLNPSYRLGFDVFIVKDIPECSSSFCLNWAHIRFNDSYHPKGKSTIDFDRVNLRGSKSLNSYKDTWIDGFFGISFLRLQQGNENSFGPQLVKYKETSKLNAGLGELGLKGKVKLSSPFYISGELGILAGVGNRGIQFNSSVIDNLNAKREMVAKQNDNIDARAFAIVAASAQAINDRIEAVNDNVNAVNDNVEGLKKNLDKFGNVANFNTVEHLDNATLTTPPATVPEKPLNKVDKLSESILLTGGNINHNICFTGVECKIEIGFVGKCYRVDWKVYAGYESVLFYDISLYFLPKSDGQFKLTTSNLGFAGPFIGITAYLPF